MADFSQIFLYADIENGVLTKSDNTSLPVRYNPIFPQEDRRILCISCRDADGNAVDLPATAQFEFGADTDYDHSTTVAMLSEDAQFNRAGDWALADISSGRLSVLVDSNTVRFEEIMSGLTGTTSEIDANCYLRQINASGSTILFEHACTFKKIIHPYGSGSPSGTLTSYYTAAQVDALQAAQDLLISGNTYGMELNSGDIQDLNTEQDRQSGVVDWTSGYALDLNTEQDRQSGVVDWTSGYALDLNTEQERQSGVIDWASGYALDLNTEQDRQSGVVDWTSGYALDLNTEQDRQSGAVADLEEQAFSGSGEPSYRTISIGDPANGHFLHVNRYGHLKLSGSGVVFKDAVADLLQITSQGAGVSLDPAEGVLDFVDSSQIADDYAYGNMQLNHDRQHAGDCYPHLHWKQTASGEPNWLFQYRWQVNGENWETAWISLPTQSGIFDYSGVDMLQISSFGAVTPPAASDVSDIVQFRLARDTDNDSTLFAGADPVTGDTHGVSLDIHYPVDSIGSDDEYAKDPA